MRGATALRRISLLVTLSAAIALIAAPSSGARTFVPKHGKVFHGVSDTGRADGFRAFRDAVSAHPAVINAFLHWDVPYAPALERFDNVDARGVISVSTKLPASGAPEITPRAIARGATDRYLLRIGEVIRNSRQVVYIRLFPEMNGHWNPYSAFNANGTRRPGHSTGLFKKAWRRYVLIVRGGKRQTVNAKLRRLRMPRIYRARSNDSRIYRRRDVPRKLPRPKVSFMWTPQTVGSPNLRGNRPQAYWPGDRYVDWVGADIYSKFESFGFSKLGPFYHRWRGHPFVIGEYSPWDNDLDGSFVRRLFAWARAHGRTRMLLYYQGFAPNDPHQVSRYPGALASLRTLLGHRRFTPWAPGARD